MYVARLWRALVHLGCSAGLAVHVQHVGNVELRHSAIMLRLVLRVMLSQLLLLVALHVTICRDSEGFSCSDLLQLCHEAAMRPVQEVSRHKWLLS
jgi:hypothetical protein